MTDDTHDAFAEVLAYVDARLQAEQAALETLREEAFLLQCSIDVDGVEMQTVVPHYMSGQAPGVACVWPRKGQR